MMNTLSDYLPAVSSLSPITVVGLAVGAAGALLYLISRVPELLLVTGTALIYALVPLFSH